MILFSVVDLLQEYIPQYRGIDWQLFLPESN